MLRKNILKEKLRNGDTVIGTWCSLSSPNVVDVLGTTGLDYVVIDMEHSSISFETVENMVRAAEAREISPIIRVSNDHEQTILSALETGAQSIMVPHVETAENAERIVRSCKYYPEGSRGLSPYTRIHDYTHENIEISLQRANEETLVGILIEGQNGLKNLKEIVKVSGIDLIYLGLFDICQSVGLPGQLMSPKVLDELDKCQKLIQSSGIAPGSMAKDVEYVKLLKEKNYQFIAYFNDASALKYHYKVALSKYI